jgi:very-short-patch-repair endonuclease
MSPLVVAQLLPGGQPLFDVVIFDEASQIRPADAISSLARGRQAVVAGDSKQLPPTTFFDVTSGSADLEDTENDIESYTQDMDSILDAMSALLPPPHGSMTLNWHYRSRDERLIAFSNAQPDLYDWSLTTFPGIAGDGCLRHVHVPYRPGLPAAADSSSDEVAVVIDLIREHAETHPDKSLGVIAMGIKHAERIQEALRLARRDDRNLDVAPCLDEGRDTDPLFVKNLERVQGDERDAIILTIGYTKTADGRMQYRFGPLNQEGGERRLNVAITRAREHMTVVSSFTPEDMDDDKLRAEGARMLKRYLTFARSGGSELGNHAMAKPALNPFELDVRTRLTRAGIPLVAQYGVAGYWIDFAAKHPERPGEMVLAIEADGATYHSAPTARARDRLRQQHLENLGWHFHRIWSGDWFRDPESQVALALTAYRAAIKAADERANGSSAVAPPKPAQPTNPSNSPPTRGARPPVPRGLPITEYRSADLDALCRWILSDTLLRTDEELLEAMMQELGYRRRGSRIVQRLNEVIKRVRRTP